MYTYLYYLYIYFYLIVGTESEKLKAFMARMVYTY